MPPPHGPGPEIPVIPLDGIPRRVPCYGPDGEQAGTAVVSAAVVPPAGWGTA